MKIRYPFCVLLLIVAAQACAPTAPDRANLAMVDPQRPTTGLAAFRERVDAVVALDRERRLALRRKAEAEADLWRDFEARAAFRRRQRDLPAYAAAGAVDRTGDWTGLARSIEALEAAVETDPSYAEAWGGLAHLWLEVGNRSEGLMAAERCLLATEAPSSPDAVPMPPDVLLQAHRDRGWALRDLGRWDEGLDAVAAGLALRPTDPELKLIEGLLLAGAGRYVAALRAAVDLPPFTVRRYGTRGSGLESRPSRHAELWIRSQALLAAGDTREALAVFGRLVHGEDGALTGVDYLDSLLRSARLQQHRRFWSDAGLVAELNDAADFPDYYMEAFRVRDYAWYYPASIHSMGPLVAGIPDEKAQCYLSFGSGYHLGGSPFAFAAAQMDIMSLTLREDRKHRAAESALQMLDALLARGVRADVCRALKGRIRYRQGRLEEARCELEAAHADFAAAGHTDGRTSLLLGVLALDREEYGSAVSYLEESADADAGVGVTWRSLGVALASTGHPDEALAAMDRALELEPASLVGHYNRGLLHLQRRRPLDAAADLDWARRLDPGNPEIERLWQLCGAALVEAGLAYPAGAATPAAAAPDSRPAPERWLGRRWADLEAILGPAPDRVPDAAALRDLCDRWEDQYRRNPTTGMRKVLALARLDLGDPAATVDLLAPGWGLDLEPDEEVLLLYAEHLGGRTRRAAGLAAAVLDGSLRIGNPYVAALAARAIRDGTGSGGTAGSHAIVAAWTDGNGRAGGHSLRQWRQLLAGSFASVRRYYLEP